jgi:phage-related tail protein
MRNIRDFKSFINESSDNIDDEFTQIVNKSIELGPIRDDDKESFKKYITDFKNSDSNGKNKILSSFSEDLEWAYEDIYDEVSDLINSLAKKI